MLSCTDLVIEIMSLYDKSMSAELRQFDFDPEKATEAILYVASKLPEKNATFYIILKILYLADKMHLSNYGRFISGDSYSAMKHGPVPSGAYDIIKYVRGDGYFCIDHARNSFSVNLDTNYVLPLRNVDKDLFSESDLQCLDKMIVDHGSKTFSDIRAISHDAAWDNAGDNEMMSLKDIVQTLPNADDLLNHLSDPFPE